MLPKSRCVLVLYLGATQFVRTWGSRVPLAPVVSGSPRFDGRRVDDARLVSIFSVLKLPWGGRRVPVAGLRLCTCQFFLVSY